MAAIRAAVTWLSGDVSEATRPRASTCADLRVYLCAEKGLFLAQLRILIKGAPVPPTDYLADHVDAETGGVAAQALATGPGPHWDDWYHYVWAPDLCVNDYVYSGLAGEPGCTPEGVWALARAAAGAATRRGRHSELWVRHAPEFYAIYADTEERNRDPAYLRATLPFFEALGACLAPAELRLVTRQGCWHDYTENVEVDFERWEILTRRCAGVGRVVPAWSAQDGPEGASWAPIDSEGEIQVPEAELTPDWRPLRPDAWGGPSGGAPLAAYVLIWSLCLEMHENSDECEANRCAGPFAPHSWWYGGLLGWDAFPWNGVACAIFGQRWNGGYETVLRELGLGSAADSARVDESEDESGALPFPRPGGRRTRDRRRRADMHHKRFQGKTARRARKNAGGA